MTMSNEAQMWALSLRSPLPSGRILKPWPKAVLVRLADYANVDHGVDVQPALVTLIASELLIDELRIARALEDLTHLGLIVRFDQGHVGDSGEPQSNFHILKVVSGTPPQQPHAPLKNGVTE